MSDIAELKGRLAGLWDERDALLLESVPDGVLEGQLPAGNDLTDIAGLRDRLAALWDERDTLLADPRSESVRRERLRGLAERSEGLLRSLDRERERTLGKDVANDFLRLAKGCPLVLLPVRLETRYSGGSGRRALERLVGLSAGSGALQPGMYPETTLEHLAPGSPESPAPGREVSLDSLLAEAPWLRELQAPARELAGLQARLGTEPDNAVLAGEVTTLARHLEGLADRLAPEPPRLLIRVYPDTLAIDGHEPGLTPDELAAVGTYWNSLWPKADDSTGREAWARLVATCGAPRAAYLVAVSAPVNRGSGDPAPQLPSLPRRPRPWSRPARPRGLPERWLAVAYRREADHGYTEIARAHSGWVRPDLALSPDPLRDGDPRRDPGLLWLTDFAAAEAAGMALRLDLPAPGTPVDRLLVFGVNAAEPRQEAPAELAALLAAQRFTHGAALVPQGSPTNNTRPAATGFDLEQDPGPPADGPLPADCDGRRLARALGLEANALDPLAGAAGNERRAARAMNNALWPVTLGYFLGHMAARLGPDREPATTPLHWGQLNEVRAHFMDWVHGRGPLAALRIDEVPYGLLPVTHWSEWRAAPGEFGGDWLVRLLTAAFAQWRIATRGLVGLHRPGGHGDEEVFALLSQDASSAEVRVRRALGPVFEQALRDELARAGRAVPGGAAWDAERARLLALLLGLVPELAGSRAAGLVFDGRAPVWDDPLVARGPVSERETLDSDPGGNYVAAIRKAGLRDLKQRYSTGQGGVPLLQLLLNLGARREFLGLALDAARRDEPRVAPDPERVAGPRTDPVEPPWLDPRTAGEPDPSAIDGRGYGDPGLQHDPGERAHFYRHCLEVLEGLPSAELQRLFGESLDGCAHRLDAWLTGQAARRLFALRDAAPGAGCHLGAFGWVEGLRPRSGTRRAEHLLAPSLAQATTAAVLRGAYRSRSGPGREQAAVQLSSTRVREALEVLEGVQAGLRLGEVLGIRFERRLLESDAAQAGTLAGLRRRHPLPVRVSKGAEAPQPEHQVLDGLALARTDDWLGQVPEGDARDLCRRLQAELAGTLDALADLLTAESVHQLLRGNADGAGAGLEALSRGAPLPDPEVAHTPVSGSETTVRLGVLLGEAVPSPWPDPADSPGRIAGPGLSAWVGGLLGDPADVACQAEARDGEASLGRLPVSAAELGLGALDLVALVRARGREGTLQALASLVAVQVRRRLAASHPDAAPAARVQWRPDQAPDGRRSFSGLVALAERVDAVLARSRPLRPLDLALPDSGDDAPEPDPVTGRRLNSLAGALAQAAGDLREALDHDQRCGLEQALAALARFGMPEALPPPDATREQLAALADTRLEEASGRLEAFRTLGATAAPVAAAEALLGEGWPFLPVYRAPDAVALGRVLQGLREPAPRATRWWQEVAMVQEAAGALRSLAVAGRQWGGERLRLGLADLDRAGRLLPQRGDALPGGGLRLAFQLWPGTLGPQRVEGLLVDAWNETVPAAEQQAGVALYADSPGSQAPNAILIAVPPRLDEGWSAERLAGVLGDTLELARVRLLDGEQLGGLAQALPLHFVPALGSGATGDLESQWLGEGLADDAT